MKNLKRFACLAKMSRWDQAIAGIFCIVLWGLSSNVLSGGDYSYTPPADSYVAPSSNNSSYHYEPHYHQNNHYYPQREQERRSRWGLSLGLHYQSGYGGRSIFPAGGALGSYRGIQNMCAQPYQEVCRPPVAHHGHHQSRYGHHRYDPRHSSRYGHGQGHYRYGHQSSSQYYSRGCYSHGCPMGASYGPTIINMASKNAWEIPYTPPPVYLDLNMYAIKYPEPRQPTFYRLPAFGRYGDPRNPDLIPRPNQGPGGVGHIPQLR